MPILTNDEEYKRYTQEAEALLGINIEDLINTIKKSKADGWYIKFEKGDFAVTLSTRLFDKNVLNVEFEAPDRSRTFTAQLIRVES